MTPRSLGAGRLRAHADLDYHETEMESRSRYSWMTSGVPTSAHSQNHNESS